MLEGSGGVPSFAISLCEAGFRSAGSAVPVGMLWREDR
jgi:hypothetical protein